MFAIFKNYFFSAFLFSAIISFVLTKILCGVKLKFKKERTFDERKIHERPVSHLGGVAIFLATLAPIFIFLKLNPIIIGFLLAGSLIFILGIIDDTFEVSPIFKIVFQSVAAIIAISSHIRISVLTLPFLGPYSGFINYLIVFLWLVGMTNAFNLIDGLDGLAAGVSVIAASTLAYVALVQKQPGPALIALSVAGASLGFLRFNFFPAKIFMGDTGSLFLGFMLAALATLIGAKKITFFTLLVPVVILGIPIFDTLFAILRRYQKGAPIFGPDADHFHHRLLSLGISQRKAVLIIYLISLALSLTSIIIAQIEPMLGLGILFGLSAVFFWVAKKFKLI